MEKILVISCAFFSLQHTVSLGHTRDPGRVLGTRILPQAEFAKNVLACLAKILSDEGYDVVDGYMFQTQEALTDSIRICSLHRDRVLRMLNQLNWYRSKRIRLASTDGVNIYLTYEEE